MGDRGLPRSSSSACSFGIHLYLWKRLVQDTTAPGRGRRVGTLALVALVLLVVGGLFLGRAGAAGRVPLGRLAGVPVAGDDVLPARRAARAGGAAAGPAADLGAPGSVPAPAEAEPARVPADGRAGRWCRRPRPAGRRRSSARRPSRRPPATVPDPGRRLLLARGLAVAAGLDRREHGRVRRDAGARPAALRPGADPAGQAAARHGRPAHRGWSPTSTSARCLGRGHTERIVDMINGLDADLVAVVGDLVDGTVAELGAAAEPLPDLRARHGSFFVTGNHEYFSGYEEWVAEVDALGLRVAARTSGSRSTGSTWPASTTSPAASTSDGPDFDAALGDRDPARPVVLLAHQPVQVERGRQVRRRPAAVRAHPRRPDPAVQPARARWSSRSCRASRRSTAPRST